MNTRLTVPAHVVVPGNEAAGAKEATRYDPKQQTSVEGTSSDLEPNLEGSYWTPIQTNYRVISLVIT